MRKFFSRSAVAVPALALAQHSMAALPTGVESAITGAGTDAATIGGLVLVVIIGIAAFKYLRRAL